MQETKKHEIMRLCTGDYECTYAGDGSAQEFMLRRVCTGVCPVAKLEEEAPGTATAGTQQKVLQSDWQNKHQLWTEAALKWLSSYFVWRSPEFCP